MRLGLTQPGDEDRSNGSKKRITEKKGQVLSRIGRSAIRAARGRTAPTATARRPSVRRCFRS